jgi:ABC-2 type transport system permease protein
MTARRIVRLWRTYAALDLSFVLADVKLFLIYIVSDAISYVALVLGMLLLAQRFSGIGPWSQPQLTFMLGYATLVRGALGLLFGYNVLFISRRIGRGQLDHTLVQPQPIWVALLTEGFNPIGGSGAVLAGAGLLIWGLSGMGIPHGPGWWAMLLVNLLGSAAATIACSFAWGSVAFWAPRAAEEISTSANEMIGQLSPFPLDGLGPALVGGLLSAVPVGFVAWYPCRALLGIDAAPYAAWVTPAAGLLLGLGAAAIFRKGLERYARTGSQRYSSFGHRG